MDIFLLYLFTRVDNILVTASIAWVLLLIVAFVCFSGFAMSGASVEDCQRFWCRVKRPFLWIFFPCLFISIMVPSKKELAIIVGGHLAIKAAHSDTAKKVYAIVEGVLDEQLAEIAKRKAK